MSTKTVVTEGPCDECGQLHPLTHLYPLDNPDQIWVCEDCAQRILEAAYLAEESSKSCLDDFA